MGRSDRLTISGREGGSARTVAPGAVVRVPFHRRTIKDAMDDSQEKVPMKPEHLQAYTDGAFAALQDQITTLQKQRGQLQTAIEAWKAVGRG